MNRRLRETKKSFIRYWDLYLLLLPVIVYFVIFKYYPMYGLQIAFKNYDTNMGITGSPWLPLDNFFKWFKMFFNSYKSGPIILNTLSLSFLQLVFSFPFPIILALVMNEMGNRQVKKTVQTVTYIPHLISTAVMVSMIIAFTNPSTGVVNKIIESVGGEPVYFMIKPGWFKPLYIISGIWQNMGWGSIIYLSALSGIDPGLYEAASIDGASRIRMLTRITLPCLLPTVIVVFVLECGSIMSLGFEKAFLMQNSMNLSVSEVISTYTYQMGIKQSNFSYSTAIGFFNSIINVTVLFLANRAAKKVTGSSLW